MKKAFCFLVALGFLVAVSAPAFAQGSEEGKGPGMDQGKKMGQRGGMGQGSMVATSDGGVVVQQGPKLFKYDATLQLVAQAQLPKPEGPKKKGREEAPEVVQDLLEEIA